MYKDEQQVHDDEPADEAREGDPIIGSITLGNNPSQLAAPVCGLILCNDHLITPQCPLAEASAAPHNPPISA